MSIYFLIENKVASKKNSTDLHVPLIKSVNKNEAKRINRYWP